ncbi:MAG: 16S rRNA (guanine(527)-N(7))-methyltransferase RsmG [Actinomycetota bacterium]
MAPGRDPAEDLAAYAGLVRAWAGRLDLVSLGDLDRFEARHVQDCLRLAPLLASLGPGPAIDVGSGAGLPGIPLAIWDRSRPWRLLEPRVRRAAFLDEVVRALALPCEVVARSAEEAARDPGLARAHVCACARALAAPDRAVALALPLIAPDGVVAIFTGSGSAAPPGSEEWAPGIVIIRGDGRDRDD